MKIVLSGGEKGTYRNVLVENNVPLIAMNITQMSIPKKKELNLKELFGGAGVFVYTSDDDEDVAKFDDFVRTYEEDIECVIGRSDYDGTWLGTKYVPLWNDDKDLERLAHLCQKYGRVAISDRAINAKTLPRIRQLQQRWGCTLVGLTSKTDVIEALPWDVVIVSSWTSVVRYGETQVWDGHGLRRYPAQKKESSRKRHRADIVRLGIDFDAVMEDDVKEVAKLSVRSWQEWEKSTFGAPSSAAYDPFKVDDEEEFDTPETGEVVATLPSTEVAVNSGNGPSGIATFVPEKRADSERVLLPIMGLETVVSVGTHDTSEGGNAYEINPRKEAVVAYTSTGLRQCDSCYLAPRCPMFSEHAECAYQIPIEVKTKAQLDAVLRAMIEMQTSRIMFAKFGEELEGQGMDPALSKEMDRLFDLVQKFKNIEDTRDIVRFEMEARAGAGVLGRIFGEKAVEKVQELPKPIPQQAIDAFIIDAEILDPPTDRQ